MVKMYSALPHPVGAVRRLPLHAHARHDVDMAGGAAPRAIMWLRLRKATLAGDGISVTGDPTAVGGQQAPCVARSHVSPCIIEHIFHEEMKLSGPSVVKYRIYILGHLMTWLSSDLNLMDFATTSLGRGRSKPTNSESAKNSLEGYTGWSRHEQTISSAEVKKRLKAAARAKKEVIANKTVMCLCNIVRWFRNCQYWQRSQVILEMWTGY